MADCHGSRLMRRLPHLFTILLLLAIIAIMQQTATQPILSSAPNLAASFTVIGVAEAAAPAAVAAATAVPTPVTPPASASSSAGMSILGPPTVSPALIDAVLAKYQSPATGSGHIIHTLGVQYGVDPAFLLAFFIHESGAGSNPRWAGHKPDGSTTHNVGNIVCTPGWRCHGRFRDYDSWAAGIEDWYKLITDLYVRQWNRTTVEEIIPKYAPAADNNNEAAYIAQVRTLVTSLREQ